MILISRIRLLNSRHKKKEQEICDGELTVLAGALTPMANVSVENKTYMPK